MSASDQKKMTASRFEKWKSETYDINQVGLVLNCSKADAVAILDRYNVPVELVTVKHPNKTDTLYIRYKTKPIQTIKAILNQKRAAE